MDAEFVFAIPRTYNYPYEFTPRIAVSTTAHQPVNITVSIPCLNQESFSINKNKSHMQPQDGKQNKIVIIRASGHVYVFAIDNYEYGGDGFQALTSSQLGTEYYVASYRPSYQINPSFICVSAIHADTSVSISNSSGSVHNVILQQYESYRYDGGEYEDLSGTLVQSNKPIAVMSGSVSQIPEETCCTSTDAILEMLIPVQNYGKTFYVFPFLSLSAGFVYRVFASDNSTTLYMSNSNVTIEPGVYYEVGIETDVGIFGEADKPIMVSQYMKASNTNNPLCGDASMLIVPPVSAYTNNVIFPVFKYTFHHFQHQYYINVATKCENVGGLLFDDAISMSSWDNVTTDSMCCVRSEVSPGFHCFSCQPSSNILCIRLCLSEWFLLLLSSR